MMHLLTLSFYFHYTNTTHPCIIYLPTTLFGYIIIIIIVIVIPLQPFALLCYCSAVEQVPLEGSIVVPGLGQLLVLCL